MSNPTCAVPECEKITTARGLCPMHYARARKTGALPARPTAADRFWAKVNKSEGCWEWIGFRDRKGYGKFYGWPEMAGQQIAHRIAYSLLVGPIPDGVLVDHKCHNTSCVNPDHLQLVDNKRNLENLSGAMRTSSSGVRGVHWRPDAKRWQALVKHDGKRYHVGYFVALEDAEAAVISKRNELFTNNLADRVDGPISLLRVATTVEIGLHESA